MIIFNSGFSTEVNCTFLHIPHPTRLRDDPKDLSKSVGQQTWRLLLGIYDTKVQSFGQF